MDEIVKNIGLLYNLSFKSRCYRKNFDLFTDNEHIVTEYDGNISKLRIGKKKQPKIIGEFGYSVWNIKLGKLLNVDIDELINKFSNDVTYMNLRYVIDNDHFNINDYDRVVFIHSLIIKNDYRKHNVTEEFIETIYREFYDERTAIIALAKPLQNNGTDEKYYLNVKTVDYLNISGDTQTLKRIPASEYYSLHDLYKKNDDEFNEYKIFAIANRCGFDRLGGSYLFKFSPEKTIKRLLFKMGLYGKIKDRWKKEERYGDKT